MRTLLETKRVSARPIVVNRRPGTRHLALVILENRVIPAAIGRSGTTIRKREGDGATPVGAMTFDHGYVRGDRNGSVRSPLGLERIRADMGWCDDPANPNYNRMVRLPFQHSHEIMSRGDQLYDYCLVLDWNYSSRRRNLGSAIFFHVARSDFRATEGCVAIPRRYFMQLLRHLRKGQKLIIRR